MVKKSKFLNPFHSNDVETGLKKSVFEIHNVQVDEIFIIIKIKILFEKYLYFQEHFNNSDAGCFTTIINNSNKDIKLYF